MENENITRYEKKHITTAMDVQEAYEYAKANNIQYYRAISNSGDYYGWLNGKHVKAQPGQEWFTNPDYIESSVTLPEEPIKKTEPISEAVVNAVENSEVNYYKELYEEAKELLTKTQDEVAKYAKLYKETNEELDSIKTAFATIAKEIETAKHKGE